MPYGFEKGAIAPGTLVIRHPGTLTQSPQADRFVSLSLDGCPRLVGYALRPFTTPNPFFLDRTLRYRASPKGTPMKSCIRAEAIAQRIGLTLAACLLSATFVSGEALAKAPKTEDEKTLYFIGMVISSQPPFSTLKPEEINMVAQGLKDSLAGETIEIDATEYGQKVQTFVQTRMEEQIATQKAAGEAYLAKMAAADGATKTESGLIYIENDAGEGDSPNPTDTVKVHYHGTLSDGTVFDSSVERGQPAEFPLNRVIPCWTEGVAMMKPGGKAQLICPADIAYGDRGAPPTIPGGATLTFEVELLEVMPATMPAP